MTDQGDYAKFLDDKITVSTGRRGFDDSGISPRLFDFQRHLVSWAIQMRSAAIFADCGMGKTPMQLEWSRIVHEQTGKPVLILTPLAVTYQTVAEGAKFGIDCARSVDGRITSPIVVTNYQKLHYFNPQDFGAVVCDESGILKSFNGATQKAISAFMRKMEDRLLCTATAAPNDFTELGTSSEALGYLGHIDMLNKFFANDLNNSSTGRQWGSVAKWRFKGHAEVSFWRWVSSWARAMRKPSDFGFDDGDFILPPLTESEHIVPTTKRRNGMLFDLPAIGLDEQREETRLSINERCEHVAELVDHKLPALVWCNLNDESKMLKSMIPDCVEVSGADSDDAKEEKLTAFAQGDVRVLVTKPKIGAFGLNFQHCAHVTFFPSHSFEQYYQGVRRCWRFGQHSQVHVDMVTTEGGRGVLDNLQRKQRQATEMFDALIEHMGDAMHVGRAPRPTQKEVVPAWL